ncbi:uncharacterized protein [Macaca nemestrina]|uniref:uncharacterized protein isoform X4 n=1 Tax=Macaca nemestrina TaxID=9545 RepID=UPI0039B85CD0
MVVLRRKQETFLLVKGRRWQNPATQGHLALEIIGHLAPTPSKRRCDKDGKEKVRKNMGNPTRKANTKVKLGFGISVSGIGGFLVSLTSRMKPWTLTGLERPKKNERQRNNRLKTISGEDDVSKMAE